VWHYALRLWCHTTPSATCPPSALIGCERCAFVSGRGPLPRSAGERAPLAGIFHSLATLARSLRAGRRCAADSLRSFQLHICALRYGSFLLRGLQRRTTGSVPSLRSCVFAARSALATATSSAYQRTLNTHRGLRGVAPPAPPLLRLVCSPSACSPSSALRPAECARSPVGFSFLATPSKMPIGTRCVLSFPPLSPLSLRSRALRHYRTATGVCVLGPRYSGACGPSPPVESCAYRHLRLSGALFSHNNDSRPYGHSEAIAFFWLRYRESPDLL
jgi:hypothetical protein